MGAFFMGLTENRILLAAVAGWFLAQAVKLLLVLILERRFCLERFFGSGGMPSSHSATVCAMASASAVRYGSSSFPFAVTAVVAFIVMYDACNVRLETGKQAVAIKELQALFRRMGESLSAGEKLKELVGHTLSQVLVGAVLGVCVGAAVALY